MWHIWGMRNVYKILVRKHEGKRQQRRHGCTWDDSIRMDLGEIGCEGVQDTYGSV